jgi:hypothetical protein
VRAQPRRLDGVVASERNGPDDLDVRLSAQHRAHGNAEVAAVSHHQDPDHHTTSSMDAGAQPEP